MARETKRADVFKVALAAAFAYRQDVVGIPEALPAHGVQAEIIEHYFSAVSASALQSAEGFHRVDSAKRAAAAVTDEHLLA